MLLDDFSAKPEYAVGVRPGILPKADCIACTAIIIVNKIIPISAIKKTREIWQLYIEEIKAVGLGHLRFINFARDLLLFFRVKKAKQIRCDLKKHCADVFCGRCRVQKQRNIRAYSKDADDMRRFIYIRINGRVRNIVFPKIKRLDF